MPVPAELQGLVQLLAEELVRRIREQAELPPAEPEQGE